MSSPHPTRREVLLGMAAMPLLQRGQQAQPSDSSVCFMVAIEVARLIQLKKLSAREALAEHLKQIERVNPKVNAIVTLAAETAADAAEEGKVGSAPRSPCRAQRPHGNKWNPNDLWISAI